PWMAGLLDEMAGKTGSPLTFGDLQARQINLEVMTTNLTHGVPVRLPFSSREFFFNPAELRSFFPGPIVEWMEAHPFVPENEDDKELIRWIVEQTPYRPLPAPAHLPVVVAARMSLSFPVLISAIPLYAIDWSLKRNQDLKKAGKAPELGRCWFSDGGIGSNFPVHFFDGLLPSRPTFGINLRPFHPDHPKDPYEESNNVRFPDRAGQEIRPSWAKIDGLFSFLGTILNTMQNWVDSTQMRLPGYRDRVVHVQLTEDEGGMNLTMPPERVEALTKRGLAAGQKLQTIDWDGHRWTRYRTAMSQLQEKLDRMEGSWSGGFEDFVEVHDSKAGRYQRPDAWKKYALEATAALMNTVRSWREHPKYRLDDEPPRPEPELRITPRR
ncbi:MAG TPA: hypothetical protein VFR31_15015, partial [Thermoanaerobaculia bacterium]|nr:hypothetical protein [Thermoanaerobaculia bacterium]